MKKLLIIPVAAIFITSCRDNTRTETLSSQVTGGAIGIAIDKAVTKKQARSTKTTTQYRDRVVYTNTSSHSAKVAQKKGMSSKAKYAIIGGVGGAVVGGVATKSTKGAVIGGVVGAGTGYILGKKRDKRTGRIQ